MYAAALRSELSARLGLSWGPIVEGHADIDGVPLGLIELFSKRSAQVEAKLAELIGRWVDEHDGVEPDARTIAKLERKAGLASRPGKDSAVDADVLRAEWLAEAKSAGFDAVSLPAGQRALPSTTVVDRGAIIADAIDPVRQASASWLRADLAREITALVPADAAPSAAALVQLVEDLATDAAGCCVELQPPAVGVVSMRKDGRPVSEHVTDRRLTTAAVLGQEARVLSWTATAVGRAPTSALTDPQLLAAEAVAGNDRLVVVIGPAGTGKTTTLGAAVRELRQRGRPVVGLAPSGKAADVLASETGAPATTLAKFLHEHTRLDGPSAAWQLPAGATVILDEAGMASTDDLAALVTLVERHRWRLACVGDPEQLPVVGRGGMFADWCDTLAHYDLDEVRRFTEAWQADASLRPPEVLDQRVL